jgi:hypothetical protein
VRRRNDDRGVKLWPPFFEGTGHRSVPKARKTNCLGSMWGGDARCVACRRLSRTNLSQPRMSFTAAIRSLSVAPRRRACCT